jgi:hypothetical protein
MKTNILAEEAGKRKSPDKGSCLYPEKGNKYWYSKPD